MLKEHAYDFLVWTKVGSEAGETIEAILKRKEFERVAGEGYFFWGVGDAPSRNIPQIRLREEKLPVCFTRMRSRPQQHDLEPKNVAVWEAYIDRHGNERPLPSYVLVTSRVDKAKPRRHALVVHSDRSLSEGMRYSFSPDRYRNYPSGKPCTSGHPVTRLLQSHNNGDGSDQVPLPAIIATLVEDFWVTLAQPRILDKPELEKLASAGDSNWLDLVAELRS